MSNLILDDACGPDRHRIDAKFFAKLSRQCLLQSLPGLDSAAKNIPAGGIEAPLRRA
jgi:hypothetical protein